MVQGAEERWQNSVAAFEDALKVQAGAVSNIEGARTAVQSLVTASQSATGALQAAQAGNQLLALQSQQLADLTATVASPRPRPVARCGQCGCRQGPGARTAPPLPRARSRLCADPCPDVPELRRWTPSSSRGSGQAAFVAVALTMSVLSLREEPHGAGDRNGVRLGARWRSTARANFAPVRRWASLRCRRPIAARPGPRSGGGSSGSKATPAIPLTTRSDAAASGLPNPQQQRAQ